MDADRKFSALETLQIHLLLWSRWGLFFFCFHCSIISVVVFQVVMIRFNQSVIVSLEVYNFC